MGTPSLPLARSRRPALWVVGLVLAAVLGAQWLTLRHAHAADGLAPQCQVCEHAPAFAHAMPSGVLALPEPVALAQSTAHASVPATRPAPTAHARGPPAPVPH